jgi:hypothetical protein
VTKPFAGERSKPYFFDLTSLPAAFQMETKRLGAKCEHGLWETNAFSEEMARNQVVTFVKMFTDIKCDPASFVLAFSGKSKTNVKFWNLTAAATAAGRKAHEEAKEAA